MVSHSLGGVAMCFAFDGAATEREGNVAAWLMSLHQNCARSTNARHIGWLITWRHGSSCAVDPNSALCWRGPSYRQPLVGQFPFDLNQRLPKDAAWTLGGALQRMAPHGSPWGPGEDPEPGNRPGERGLGDYLASVGGSRTCAPRRIRRAVASFATPPKTISFS